MNTVLTRVFRLGMVVGLAAMGGGVQAETSASAPLLTRPPTCATCHKLDNQLVGPAYREIAKKYQNQARTAPDYATELEQIKKTLQAKVSAGGSGVWGDLRMPSNSRFGAENIARMVEWILDQEPLK